MSNKKKKNEKGKMQPAPVIVNPDTLTPQYCNQVLFSRIKGSVIITLIYRENDKTSTVLKRVIVSEEHAEEILSVLDNLLKKKDTKDAKSNNKQ